MTDTGMTGIPPVKGKIFPQEIFFEVWLVKTNKRKR